MRLLLIPGIVISLLVSGSSNAQSLISHFPDSSAIIQIKTIPPGYYCTQLPFTCKTELAIQKKLGLPIFLRLGSLEFVDYLERKKRAPNK